VSTLLERWVYALKPASWPKLAVPALLGIALGFAETRQISPLGIALALLFTVLDLIYVVTLNDWGDQEVDRKKRQMFPDGCSRKTIPDGILPAQALLIAGLSSGVAMVLVALLAERLLERPGLGLLALGAAAVFAAYTFPPLALNYRGGGEILEMLGVGVVLPLVTAAFVGGGGLSAIGRAVLPGLALVSFSSALASGLSDEESDRAGNKSTFTTWLGNERVRQLSLSALLAGAGAWTAAALLSPRFPLLGLSALIPLGLYGRQAALLSPRAITNAFAEQGRFKKQLHLAIWGATLALAAALVLDGARELA
jgi:1,4-dihydroxy-2-naphthoate octaprenyltransferase/chlorophyll synthase